jgi:hypothetical protein
MCHCRRLPGIGLIALGLVVLAAGVCHTFGAGCRRAHRAQFEQHVAEVCVKAAAQVQK